MTFVGPVISGGPRLIEGAVVREPRLMMASAGHHSGFSGCEVLVKEGQRVEPGTVIARVPVEGDTCAVDVAAILGVSPGDLPYRMVKDVGDRVTAGEVIATCRGFMGVVVYLARSPVSGVISDICPFSGVVSIAAGEEFVGLAAGLGGAVVEVWPGRGAVVEAEGILVEGVAGAGGFAYGRLKLLGPIGSDALGPCENADGPAGPVVVTGRLDRPGVRQLAAAGAAGVVTWSVSDFDAGGDSPHIPVVVMGGFGDWPPGGFVETLEWAEGLLTAVNGVSFPGSIFISPPRGGPCPESRVERNTDGEPCGGQVAAGAATRGTATARAPAGTPAGNARVRVTAGPHAGRTGTIVEELPGLQAMTGGAVTRAARVRLDGGEYAAIPVQNLEMATRGVSHLRAKFPGPCRESRSTAYEEEKGS